MAGLKERVCALHLSGGWLVVLWPPLIAGVYDPADAPGPVAGADSVGNGEGKGGLLLLFPFPLQSGLLESREETHRHLHQGMTSHKTVLYVF